MMDFFNAINDALLVFLDPVFGWLLHLPTDAALFVVAIGTSAILTLVRLFTTNQDLLRRCAADKKRLKVLKKEAKLAGDKEALKRYRATGGVIAGKTMAAEGKPLLASIIPIALLATWCFARLGFYPPQPDEELELRAYFPVSSVGQLAHVVPAEGLEATNSWVQRVVEDPIRNPDGSVAAGLALWKFKAAGNENPYKLQIRHAGETQEKELLVGQRIYAPNLAFYENDSKITCAELKMREVKLFGFVPGIEALFCPPWIVAYLLIAIPFVYILKWIFRIL